MSNINSCSSQLSRKWPATIAVVGANGMFVVGIKTTNFQTILKRIKKGLEV